MDKAKLFRPTCPLKRRESVSDRRYPARPILGVAGVMFRGDAVLLGRRAHEPAMGEWSLPGGVVEVGESLVQALEREFLEEVCVRIRVGGLVHLVERIIPDRNSRVEYHYVIADYWGWIEEGRPRPASDVSDVRLVPVDRLDDIPLHGDVRRTIVRAVRLRRESGQEE
jgi:ADP-ribose pyrophosphatase YjhB (NUDIX family)